MRVLMQMDLPSLTHSGERFIYVLSGRAEEGVEKGEGGKEGGRRRKSLIAPRFLPLIRYFGAR
jgi:hypothetical protein